MITGYNTDVRHGNRVFHVQTEDKGLANPRIETLIYVGGEIVDSIRGSYEDLLHDGRVDEPIVQERMDEQHKQVIQQIKTGKYDSTPQEPEALERKVFNERPLDQAILEYLQQEGDVDVLEMVLDEPLNPVFGAPFTVRFKTRLSLSQAPVEGATVTLRLVSSLKKAVVLGTGRTDAHGGFEGRVELPTSQPGQMSLVITVTGDAGTDEVRCPVMSL